MNSRLKRRLQLGAGSILLPFLVACNGGSESSSNTTSSQSASATPALPQATALTASNGNMDVYVGTWSSDCGQILLGGNGVKSARNVYTLTKASGQPLSGKLEQYKYSDDGCGTPLFGIDIPLASELVTVRFVAKSTLPTPTSSYNNFSGTADKVEITHQARAGAATSKTTNYLALQGTDHFRLTSSLPFTKGDLTYTKQR